MVDWPGSRLRLVEGSTLKDRILRTAPSSGGREMGREGGAMTPVAWGGTSFPFQLPSIVWGLAFRDEAIRLVDSKTEPLIVSGSCLCSTLGWVARKERLTSSWQCLLFSPNKEGTGGGFCCWPFCCCFLSPLFFRIGLKIGDPTVSARRVRGRCQV